VRTVTDVSAFVRVEGYTTRCGMACTLLYRSGTIPWWCVCGGDGVWGGEGGGGEEWGMFVVSANTFVIRKHNGKGASVLEWSCAKWTCGVAGAPLRDALWGKRKGWDGVDSTQKMLRSALRTHRPPAHLCYLLRDGHHCCTVGCDVYDNDRQAPTPSEWCTLLFGAHATKCVTDSSIRTVRRCCAEYGHLNAEQCVPWAEQCVPWAEECAPWVSERLYRRPAPDTIFLKHLPSSSRRQGGKNTM
jgi:hypothetical protein